MKLDELLEAHPEVTCCRIRSGNCNARLVSLS